MTRSAVLAGRTLADLARNVFVVALMVVIGAGRLPIHTGPLPFLGGMLLVLLFAYSMSWVFATVGLLVGDPGDGAGGGLPGDGAAGVRLLGVRAGELDAELAAGANHQPVSVTASAVRALVLGADRLTSGSRWPGPPGSWRCSRRWRSTATA